MNEKIILIAPCEEYAEQIAELKHNFMEHDPNIIGCGRLAEIEVAAWIKECEEMQQGKNLPEDYVPATQFIAIRESDNKLIGVIQIRHKLNPPWDKIGGHVGYSVVPTEWNKGYGTEILRLSLDECHRLGMSKIYLTCLKSNTSSAKVIENNGGIFEGEHITSSDGPFCARNAGELLHRYYIIIEEK